MRHFLLAGTSLLALSLSTIAAMADDSTQTDNETVLVTTQRSPKTAGGVAPGQTPMNALEPETDISSYYIKQIASQKDDYLSLMEFSPSGADANPNGAGLSSKNGTIRGFQDGYYNVTFDGIPFGDPASYTHATTSFFPATVLGGENIDRGPGTASDIGNATFGGTMALYSNPLLDKPHAVLTGSYGSGDTYQAGIDLQSGAIAATGGTKIDFNYERTESDGLIKYAGLKQDNYFLKAEQPIGDDTHITVMSERTTLNWHDFGQSNVKNTEKYGYDYGNLNNDPTSQSYEGYNDDDRPGDFSYIGLDTTWKGFTFTDKAYTYGLDDHEFDGISASNPSANTSLLASGVPGVSDGEDYRAWGDIAQLSRDFGHGWTSVTVKTGVWYEHTYEGIYEYSLNLVNKQIETLIPYKSYGPIIDQLRAQSDTVQSYLEFDWHPLPGLTITPGWKHEDFQRNVSGIDSFATVKADNSYAVDMGSVSANYRINQHFAVYGQWAMGFQPPEINTQEAANSAYQTLNPQQTINYQAGVIYKSDRLVADVDAYYINFRNMIAESEEPVGAGGAEEEVYRNGGGVYYKGVEAEATWRVGWGLSLTANGSINSASYKGSDLQIANSPTSTADFGPIYDDGKFYGSMLTKYVGRMFDGTGQLVSGANYTRLPAYSYTDLTVGWRINKHYRLQFQVDNLFNNRAEIDGNGSATLPTFYYLAGRNFYGTVTVSY